MFAGGGTGGHIYPNIAVLESLQEQHPWQGRFCVSSRPLDAAICHELKLSCSALGVEPPAWRPWRWPRQITGWQRAYAVVHRMLAGPKVLAVVATGGFVSLPAVAAALRMRVPLVLVNLDAIPGKVNRLAARHATAIFTAYPVASWPRAWSIGLPLRRSVIGPGYPARSRATLGLASQLPTLLVVGGSQGAASLNRMMASLVTAQPGLLEGWQVLHAAGSEAQKATLVKVYNACGVPAVVMPFCHQMGSAWDAATLAISRAGAGSVAEAWANAVPAIYLPYPYHRDEHQKHNVQPVLDAGGGLLMTDRIDPQTNAAELASMLGPLTGDQRSVVRMSQALRRTWPGNGADVVADWLGRLPDRGGTGCRPAG